MTVVTEHIKHEAAAGTLIIDVHMNRDDETLGMSAAVSFECHDTGAIFAKTYDTKEITALHRIYSGMPELFIDFIRERPSKIAIAADHVTLDWNVTHGRRVYEFALSFGISTHTMASDAINELQQENRVLRRRVKLLKERIIALEDRANKHNENMSTLAEYLMFGVSGQIFPTRYISRVIQIIDKPLHAIEVPPDAFDCFNNPNTNHEDFKARFDPLFAHGLRAEQLVVKNSGHVIFKLIDGLPHGGETARNCVLYLLAKIADLDNLRDSYGKSVRECIHNLLQRSRDGNAAMMYAFQTKVSEVIASRK